MHTTWGEIKRAFFAGVAMHAWLSLGTDEASPNHEVTIAKLALDQADAMLQEMEARRVKPI